jgi:hypothetical protein
MKQKDIIVIIVVVAVSGMLAAVTSKFAIHPSDKQQKVEVVQAITPDFPTPDSRFFNKDSIDPTLPISIGDNTNTDPFKGATGR